MLVHIKEIIKKRTKRIFHNILVLHFSLKNSRSDYIFFVHFSGQYTIVLYNMQRQYILKKPRSHDKVKWLLVKFEKKILIFHIQK
jgi:hypothetical protein